MSNLKSEQNLLKFDNTFYDFATHNLVDPILTENFEIVQAVDSHYFSAFNIGTHTQYCDIELTCSLLGEVECITGEQGYFLQNGDCHICFRGESHTLQTQNACRFQTLAFNVRSDSKYNTILQEFTRRNHQGFCVKESEQLSRLIGDAVFSFYNFDGRLSVLQLECLLGLILITLLRGEELPVDPLSDDELLLYAVNCIDTRFKEILTVFELVEHTGHSYNYLFQKFSEKFHTTPKKYLTYKKMDYACRHLAEGSILLSQLAAELHYSSAYNFSRAFKEYTGLSPTAYKTAPFPLENPLLK